MKATDEYKNRVWKHRRHVAWTLTKGALLFVCAWALATLACWYVTSKGMGHWIELLNGATWPSQFRPAFTATPQSVVTVPIGSNLPTLGFFIVLGLRTILNLGVILSGVALLFVIFSSIGKEWLMTKMASMLSSRDSALAAYVLIELSKEDKKLPPDIQDSLMTKAAEFSTSAAGQMFLERFYSDAQSAARELAAHRAQNA